jgi:DNA mismatch repair protein MutS
MAYHESPVYHDYHVEEEHDITIVGGAANSGKSMHLKTLGTVIYLTQIGCYVPAQSVEVPIFSKLLTNVREDDERESFSLAKGFNYTEKDAMSAIFKESDSNSFILIDEYGRGVIDFNEMGVFKNFIETYGMEKNYLNAKTNCN